MADSAGCTAAVPSGRLRSLESIRRPLAPTIPLKPPVLLLPEEFAVGVPFVEVDAFGAALVHVDELGVVEAEQVQDRGVEVVDVQAVLDGVEAEFVGRADRSGRRGRRRRPSTS